MEAVQPSRRGARGFGLITHRPDKNIIQRRAPRRAAESCRAAVSNGGGGGKLPHFVLQCLVGGICDSTTGALPVRVTEVSTQDAGAAPRSARDGGTSPMRMVCGTAQTDPHTHTPATPPSKQPIHHTRVRLQLARGMHSRQPSYMHTPALSHGGTLAPDTDRRAAHTHMQGHSTARTREVPGTSTRAPSRVTTAAACGGSVNSSTTLSPGATAAAR
jgi:hypothetical protein